MTKYRCIYADPPWRLKSVEVDREIAALDVGQYAAQDCVLLMWAPDPLLERAFAVLKSWGFRYKTVGFYWAKTLTPPMELVTRGDNLPAVPGAKSRPLAPDAGAQLQVRWAVGAGRWARDNPEQCLLATRGSPQRVDTGVPKLVVAPQCKSARKPEEVYVRIERLCAGPYLELFARARRPGWDIAFSNEIALDSDK